MVMRLKHPAIVNADFIDAVVNERRGGKNAAYFAGVCAAWKARVQDYIDVRGNPEHLQPWPGIADHRTKYVNLYSSPGEGSIQAPLLANLRSRTLQLCPSCGEDGTPNTLDHYLPKDTYPEFSIIAANLAPMCDKCQGEKSTKTLNAANERLFLHPYFDEFTETRVMQLRIGRPLEAPDAIELSPHPALGVAQAALVARHLAELAISKRYYRFFRAEYLRLFKLARRSRDQGQNVRQNLQLFADHALDKSPNSWGYIFYSAVLADDELLLFLEEGNLPEFV